MALARVAGARGDTNEQRRVLQHLTELDDTQATAEQRKLAQFALVELELTNPSWRSAGVKSLERALEGLTDYERPKALLRAAAARAPKDDALAALFERVARASRDPMMLLEHFERRAGEGELSLPQLHEPIELALRQGEHRRAEALLERAAALADAEPEAKADRVWVHSRLSDCRRQAGDVGGAVAQLALAAEAAEGEEGDALMRDLAELAMGPGGDLEVAASAYLKLLEREYGNRDLCLQLLRVYASIGERARFEQFAERCAAELSLSVDRVAVYLAHARFLIDVASDERAAVPVLKTLLEEEPGHAQATEELSGILQKHGMNEELADLLHTHFDRARDAQNLDAIAELATRINSLYGDTRRDAAMDVLRAAIEWQPGHAGLLRAMLTRLGPDADARDRADIMQSLLAIEQGPSASALALQVAPLWSELGDSERAGEALERGLAADPENAELRDRLEAFYGEQEQWRPLAELLEREAERLGAVPSAVARLRNAASLYREQLDDLEAASGALRKALVISPSDLGLLGELARNLAASGRHEEGVADVTRLLQAHSRVDTSRVHLLLVRAELRIALEQLQEAVSDLEEAYDIEPGETRGALIDALERQKTAAFTSGDAAAERRAALRLIEVHDAAGDRDAARDALAGWVDQAPDDIAAARALRARDLAAERWDDVVVISERLIDRETGEEQAESAIVLADACASAGRAYDARGVLEHVRAQQPDNMVLRDRLRTLYETTDCKAELAGILLEDAGAAADNAERVALLQRAARLYLDLGDTEAALGPLNAASELSPEDTDTQLLVVDIAIQRGQLADAQQRLEAAINVQRKRRSPELALLYQRMGRLSAAQGDVEEQLKWLNQAMEIDRRSGELAAELAEAAMAAESYDTAMKALRAITMMEDPQPMSRATAFLKQAQIAFVRGDPRRAQHWARKAKSLDENMPEIDAFLAQIEG
jgi:tetratricopeptide (TPR) repeat protein